MTIAGEPAGKTWRDVPSQQWNASLREREEQAFLVLTLVIGALVGVDVGSARMQDFNVVFRLPAAVASLPRTASNRYEG